MKRLPHGPGSDPSLGSRAPLLALPRVEVEREADPCACRIKRKPASMALALSRGKDGAERPAGKDEPDEGQLSWDGYIKAPRGPSLRPSPGGLEGAPELRSSAWRRVAEEQEGLGPPGQPPPAPLSCRAPPRDRSADVIEYIVKELQGIGRIQTEIAELQQHLAAIKGSVDEVSSCVDTVLSEIEGLQGGGSGGRASAARKARAGSVGAPPRSHEAILYFYGLPEREGEDTKQLVCRFLSEYRCFNGLQHGQYVREAYRASGSARVPPVPRPAVVRLADPAQRDFILQRAILLQSVGVTVVARGEQSPPNGREGQLEGPGETPPSPGWGPAPWGSGTLQGEGVRTDGDGQFQLDSGQGRPEDTRREAHTEEAPSACQKPTSAGEEGLSAEVGEPAGGARQRTGARNEHQPPNGASPSGDVDASAKQPEGHGPESHRRDSRSSAVEGLNAVGEEPTLQEGGGRGREATQASPERAVLPAEDKAGGPTPGDSETDGDASTQEFLSPEPGSLLEESPPAPATVAQSHESTVRKLVGSSETLKDVIPIDLNEQDPAEQVFRDVLENSQYFLEHSRESLDLVDMRFYTNKLGKALGHFRSALQVVFHKLEAGDPEVLLEGEKSFRPAAHEPAPALRSSSTHSHLETLAESPPSRSSDSPANATLSSEGVGLAEQRALPAGPLSSNEAPVPDEQPLPEPESCWQEPLPAGPAEPPNGCRPMSLEKVCAETIYLNRCISNFKNVLREKRQMRQRLLRELAREPSWSTSAEEMPSGTCMAAAPPLVGRRLAVPAGKVGAGPAAPRGAGRALGAQQKKPPPRQSPALGRPSRTSCGALPCVPRVGKRARERHV